MQKKAGGLCAALFQEENTMENRIVTGSGAMRCHCVRLKRGEDLLESICALEKELAAKTGKEVALVAYSPVKYAQLSDDADALAKITELEQLLSKKTGKDVVLVAFSI